MDTVGSNNDTLQGNIRNAADQAVNTLSGKVEAVRNTAAPMMAKVADQAQSVAKQGMETINAAKQQVRDTAGQLSDAVISYTRERPVTAILIAAASGALLLTLIKALTPSRTRMS